MFDMNELNLNEITKNIANDNSGVKMDITLQQSFIEDIVVVAAAKKGNICVPAGYEKIDVDLNEGAGGDYIYFCFKRGTDENKAINGITFAVGKNDKVSAPAGYQRIGLDLNKGAGGKYIYLCIRRGKDNPIHDLKVVSSKSKDANAPDGYTMIKQDLNEKAGGRYIYLCYA